MAAKGLDQAVKLLAKVQSGKADKALKKAKASPKLLQAAKKLDEFAKKR